MKLEVYTKFFIYSFVIFLFLWLIFSLQFLNELHEASNLFSSNPVKILAQSNSSKKINLKSYIRKNIRSWIIRPKCRCLNNSVKINEFENFYSIYSFDYKKHDLLYEISKNDLNFTIQSCSDYHSLINGPSQKIIAYSLYGKNRKYYKNFENLARQVKKFYGTDWKIRIYHDNSIDESIICKYECEYANLVQFCSINELRFFNFSDYNGMYWRWIPLMDNFVDYIQSRDLDSWIIEREYQVTSEWLRSRYSFHVIRDHPFHFFPILGGLWSIASKRNRTLSIQIFLKLIDKSLIRPYNNRIYLEDQYFLIHHVWPLVQSQTLVHDSFYCTQFPTNGLVKPFPTQRPDTECFVSCSNCCENTMNEAKAEHGIKSVSRMCPIECRFEIKWIYC